MSSIAAADTPAPEPSRVVQNAVAVSAASAAESAQDAATEAATAADAAENAAGGSPFAVHARTRSMLAFLLLLVVLYTAFLARELIVPVVLAMFLALCGNPIVARLQRWGVARAISGLLVVGGTLAALVFALSLLMTPATQWLRQAPDELRQHLPKLRELTRPFEDANRATESLQQMADMSGSPAATTVRVVAPPPPSSMLDTLADAPRTLASVLAVVILSFFFMVYGENLLRRAVSVAPTWHQKRTTVHVLRSIQTDISRYMLTVTLINAGLGLATAAALWGIGLDPYDAALWGAVAGLLNFAPYVGPLFAAVGLMLVGLVQFDNLPQAMLPPAAFLLLHLVEGQLITPIVLGRRMAISPVILMLWLFLWGWMWGILGLLLAVPMLVCFKIYCSRVPSMRAWAMMMEP